MRIYEKSPVVWHYHNYTEKNVVNTVAAVYNNKSEKLDAEIFKYHVV